MFLSPFFFWVASMAVWSVRIIGTSIISNNMHVARCAWRAVYVPYVPHVHATHHLPYQNAPRHFTHARTHTRTCTHAPYHSSSFIIITHLPFWSGHTHTGPGGKQETRRGRPSVRKACGGQESSCQETRHTAKCVFFFSSFFLGIGLT